MSQCSAECPKILHYDLLFTMFYNNLAENLVEWNLAEMLKTEMLKTLRCWKPCRIIYLFGLLRRRWLWNIFDMVINVIGKYCLESELIMNLRNTESMLFESSVRLNSYGRNLNIDYSNFLYHLLESVSILVKSVTVATLTNFQAILSKCEASNIFRAMVFHLTYSSIILKFHLTSWCGHFVETHNFRWVSRELPETMRKLCASTKFPPHQDIRWNFSIFCSDTTKRGTIRRFL